MTQAPTPGPLDSESVKLLVKGDWLTDGFYDPWQFSHIENGTVYGLDGYTAMIEPLLVFNSFIGRPDADGWMPWSGGENPVPGRRVDWVNARGDKESYLSDEVCGFGAPLGGNSPIVKWRLASLAPTAPVEASGSEREKLAATIKRHLLGVAPDDQDVVLEDDDWQLILSALRPQPSGETREIAQIIREEYERLVVSGDDKRDNADRAADRILALSTTPARAEAQDEGAALTVWYGSMPESNGKANWTAVLHRKSDTGFDLHGNGFCFARSEYPERVRYEADEMRWLIGELAEKPCILDYDEKAHSGYSDHPSPPPADEDRVTETLALFRAFVSRNAAQWEMGAGDHHHPMWAHVAEALGDGNAVEFRDGPAYRFIQPDNREALAALKSTAAKEGEK